ncbi:chromate transporter [Irregularibacter muris]|uniref:Chromate transporter n=1 Tax=Irregularibacter muris TaxID=1796619 RepID=A0AAE3HF18_9FIRM|nr:chromate transporter [Irregularibacter muris]MCR1899406.1 chromate transporter [Irregularibacter muris]
MKLINIFLVFLKIGAFSFGGGYAMIPFIQREIIVKNGWLDIKEFLDIIAIAEVTPGPIAVNSATFVGYKYGGLIGSIVATLAIISVSFILIVIISRIYDKFKQSNTVKAVFLGIRPTILGLILSAAVTVGKSAFTGTQSILIALVIFIAVYKYKLHPIIAILSSGVMGVLLIR